MRLTIGVKCALTKASLSKAVYWRINLKHTIFDS
jgi:hypothetical protein